MNIFFEPLGQPSSFSGKNPKLPQVLRLRQSQFLFRACAIPLLATLLASAFLPVAKAAPPSSQAIKLSTGWELSSAEKVSDTGETISEPSYYPPGWFRAAVPGTVLTSLVNDQVYPEPLYGENNRPDKIPDTLCRTSYWYRTTFTAPSSYSGKQIWLTFEGINYIAEVFVNGKHLGAIQGAFTRGIFNVTGLVSPGAESALAVHVFPQPHPGLTHEKTIAKGTGRNGGVTGLDGPTFLCSIGWDWIPTIRDRDTGIWQDVLLSATGPLVIQNPYVTSKLPLPRTDSADLTVEATVSNATDTAQSGVLSGIIEGIAFHHDVALQPRQALHVTFTPSDTPSLHLSQPRLWWPNGFGPQNLYTLRLVCSCGGELSDQQQTSFGIRQIEYSVPGSSNLTLSVNGVPVMAKGGDWGMDEAMKRIPRKRLDAAVRMHQIANYTILRNWVGQSTSANLYDLCDKYGILMWDEFFEPHPLDGPIPDNVPLYLANVRDKILRFRNHPCIALWCARNEGDPPPAIGEGIKKLLDELDPSRLYQPSSTSGRGVNSGGPYHWRTPREFYSYTEAFKTEIGSISVPTLEAVQAMMPAKDWEVINDDWAEHDFCSGAQQGDRYPEILSRRYGYPIDLADFVRKAQLMNYECFRAMYEGRFARMFQPETGVITWMSHPAQPSFVWQLYSHDLEPNSSLYATREACEPVHIMLDQSNWRLLVVNNRPEPLQRLRARVSVYNLDGTLRYAHTQALTAKPSAVTDAGEVAFPADLSPVHFVKLALDNSSNRPLSENFYWRATPGQEDDFRALNQLPTVTLEVQAQREDVAGECLLDVTIHNPEKSVALLAHLQLRQDRSGRRVLPVFYSDNYVSLLPGETKSLTVEAASVDLERQEPLLMVDGWNVTVRPVSASRHSIRVEPNTEAQVSPLAAADAAKLNGAININCGGGQLGFFRFGFRPVNNFISDDFFAGGAADSTDQPISATGANAGPVALYQSERWGQCTYKVPVEPGRSYTVRLHFAETRYGPGERKFNVDINGHRVLGDFDIAAEAGKDQALVKDFPGIEPGQHGQIVLAFTKGSANEPKICGIQVLPK